jgi:hypothetical protein
VSVPRDRDAHRSGNDCLARLQYFIPLRLFHISRYPCNSHAMYTPSAPRADVVLLGHRLRRLQIVVAQIRAKGAALTSLLANFAIARQVLAGAAPAIREETRPGLGMAGLAREGPTGLPTASASQRRPVFEGGSGPTSDGLPSATRIYAERVRAQFLSLRQIGQGRAFSR